MIYKKGKTEILFSNFYFTCLILIFSLFGLALQGREVEIDSLNKRLSSGIVDSTDKLGILKALSMAYWKVSPDSSIYYGKLSLCLAESLENEEEKATAFHNLGVAYFYANSFETSLENFYKSLAIREKNEDPYKIGTSLNSIGNVYYALNNIKEALKYYNRSLELIRESGNMKMEASILINMGSVYASKGEKDKAFDLLNQAVIIHEKLGDSIGLSSAFNNLALVYRENGDYAKSISNDLKALNISKKMNKSWEISYISNSLGETYLLMKNFDKAYYYFNQALEQAEKIGSDDVLLFSFRSFTKYYSAKGDYNEFDEYFKKYEALKDRIFTTENTRSIAEMQVKYETEHKEKENALQKLQITKERSLRNSFIFISLLVLILVVILFFRYRVKKKLSLELESLVKHRTQALFINQSKLKEAQRIGRSGSWDWELVSNKLDWSDELPNILGLSPDELNIPSILKIVHPDDRQALQKIFRKEFSQFSSDLIDIRLMRNGKIKKYISVDGEVTRNEKGVPVLMQGTIQDITERKLAELALKESEELYRKLISASPDAVIKIDLDGLIVFASQQSKLLFRANTIEEILGTSILNWTIKADRLRLIENVKSLFKDIHERDSQYILQRTDGSTFTGELKTAVIYDSDDNAKGLIAVVRNITDRKLLEQSILRNTIETEERERARFSEDLHDGLGPLLSTVKIHLELIAARMGNPIEQEKFIKMTDELLQESIRSTREIANNLTPNVLNDFGLYEALSVYIEKINKTNTLLIDLKFEGPRERIHQQIEVTLYRVICELINNTLKHASADKININVFKDKQQIEITYIDNGIGFDLQKMLSSPSKGLGLSNISSRINSVNGKITFASEPGRNFVSLIKVDIP